MSLASALLLPDQTRESRSCPQFSSCPKTVFGLRQKRFPKVTPRRAEFPALDQDNLSHSHNQQTSRGADEI